VLRDDSLKLCLLFMLSVHLVKQLLDDPFVFVILLWIIWVEETRFKAFLSYPLLGLSKLFRASFLSSKELLGVIKCLISPLGFFFLVSSFLSFLVIYLFIYFGLLFELNFITNRI
jgi:hypothetical protein